ncbi:Short-chain dehydrogenase/reductase SDR [Penicillium alfredii]|uniref:Short-chain dehydrogenase/reductase SDR n=1 Tax=Penicillium alfredii TaxID=1506179 RepID=A0A9W9F8X9_9EURO|nr:Short-chain dehydrogenase/reductase SDR [Penicillium alfredii]KAJ5095644.1 Short-chain dehydrogenase/reductase SDR [Penicillium alfredii]
MSTPTFKPPNRPLTWLITGSSSGLGLAITRQIQADGHKVIATSRQPSRTPELVREIEEHGGEWHALDVDNTTSGPALIHKLEAAGENIDVLVNNAGAILFGAMEQFTDEELRAPMETMYFGPSRLIRAVLPAMRERRFGLVVNISSGAALDGKESMGAYAGAKAALDGSSRVLAKEVAPFNIRVLTVWLGTFNTNIGNASALARNPLPDVYQGSMAARMMDAISSGNFPANGDRLKAAKAIYEVAVGEGGGAGRETELFLPMGGDMISRVEVVRDQCVRALEVFGDVAASVGIDAKA